MRRQPITSILVALFVALPCGAQRPASRDVGLDLGLRSTSAASGMFDRSMDQLRMGFPLSESLSLEPSVLFFNPFGVGGESVPLIGSGASIGLALVYRLDAEIAGGRPYLRPFVDLVRGEAGVAVRGDAGFGLGVNVPVRDRLAIRAEGAALTGGGRRLFGSLEQRFTLGLTYLRQ